MEYIDEMVKNTFILKLRPQIDVPLPQEAAYGTRQLSIDSKKMEDLKKCVDFVTEEEKVKFWNGRYLIKSKMTNQINMCIFLRNSFVVQVNQENKTYKTYKKNGLIVKTQLVYDGSKNPPYPKFSN